MKKKIFGLVLFFGMLFVSFSVSPQDVKPVKVCVTVLITCSGGTQAIGDFCGDTYSKAMDKARTAASDFCRSLEGRPTEHKTPDYT